MKSLHQQQILLALLLCFLVQCAWSQAPDIAWQLSLGDSNDDFVQKMIPTHDEGLLILTRVAPPTDPDKEFDAGDIKIYKLNKNRDIEWTRIFRGPSTEHPVDACEIEDGFMVAVSSPSKEEDFSENYGSSDIWILKITHNGDLVWKRNYGGSGPDFPERILALTEQRFLIVGYTNSPDHDVQNLYGEGDVWLFEIDENGDILRSKSFGGSKTDALHDALVLSNGNLILVGESASSDYDVPENSGEADGWVLELDEQWNILTNRVYGGPKVDYFSSIVEDNDGFVIAGSAYSDNVGIPNNDDLLGKDLWVLKLNNYRTRIWSRLYGGSKFEYASGIKWFNNQLIVFGSTLSNDGDISHQFGFGVAFWLLLMDKNGILIWEKTFGGSGGESGRDLLINDRGEIIMLGESDSKDGDLVPTPNVPYNRNVWLVGLTSIFPDTLTNGCEGFVLAPNPVVHDQQLQCHFSESVSLSAQLDFFNAAGQKIGATQSVELVGKNPGIDLPSTLVSGTYFVKITTPQERCIKKIVVSQQ